MVMKTVERVTAAKISAGGILRPCRLCVLEESIQPRPAESGNGLCAEHEREIAKTRDENEQHEPSPVCPKCQALLRLDGTCVHCG